MLLDGLPTYAKHLYKTWYGMRQRCCNQRNPNYKNYGGRGITICKRWQKFENFVFDMGERPLNTTLDRKNNNGDYSPKNCQWATQMEQACNKQNSVLYTINNVTKSMRNWERFLNLTPYRLHMRHYRKQNVEAFILHHLKQQGKL